MSTFTTLLCLLLGSVPGSLHRFPGHQEGTVVAAKTVENVPKTMPAPLLEPSSISTELREACVPRAKGNPRALHISFCPET